MTDKVEGSKDTGENLDLPPGYYTKRDEAGVYLMDSEGQKVVRLPEETALADPPAKPHNGGRQESGRSLEIRLSESEAECESLRQRVAELEERLKAAETERDQANAIAEDLYEFFRKRVREIANRKKGYGKLGD